MTDRTATISFSDGAPSVTFPILQGTLGPDVIDIRTLYGKTGRFTYDPGTQCWDTPLWSATFTYRSDAPGRSAGQPGPPPVT